MRPVSLFSLLLACFALIFGVILTDLSNRRESETERQPLLDILVSGLGLTDLCVSTEARYTRHPAVSDLMTPFMDHPGAIEHFPSGSFLAPPPYLLTTSHD